MKYSVRNSLNYYLDFLIKSTTYISIICYPDGLLRWRDKKFGNIYRLFDITTPNLSATKIQRLNDQTKHYVSL